MLYLKFFFFFFYSHFRKSLVMVSGTQVIAVSGPGICVRSFVCETINNLL